MYTGINSGFTLLVNFLFLKKYFRAVHDVPFSLQPASIIGECTGRSGDFLKRQLNSRKAAGNTDPANQYLLSGIPFGMDSSFRQQITFIRERRSGILKNINRILCLLCSGKSILLYINYGLLKRSLPKSSCRPPPLNGTGIL